MLARAPHLPEVDMTPDFRRLLWLLLPFTVILALVIGLVFQDALQQVILLPLQYLFWLMNLLIQSVDQGYFWALLVVIGVVMAIRLVVTRRIKLHQRQGEAGRQVTGRVTFWALMIQRTRRGWYLTEYARYRLRSLVLGVLAHYQQLSLQEAEKRLRRGEIKVPPAVMASLAAQELHPAPPRRLSLAGLVQPFRRLPAQPSAFEAELDELIEFLEDSLKLPSQ